MPFGITTPALLFPALSLLLLAYTNRFLGLSTRIRTLHDQYHKERSSVVLRQIENLRKRVILIRNMQSAGMFSMFLCVLCMFLIFAGQIETARYLFGASLLSLLLSLYLSLREVAISVEALNLLLSDIEEQESNLPTS